MERFSWKIFSVCALFVGYITTVQAALLVNNTTSTSITENSAILNTTVTNTSGSTAVDVNFDWGTTGAYGFSTVATTVPASSTINISKSISGLTCNTTYHFAASWFGGAFRGPDTTFTTSACPATGPTLPQAIDNTVKNTLIAQSSAAIRVTDLQISSVSEHINRVVGRGFNINDDKFTINLNSQVFTDILIASAGDDMSFLGDDFSEKKGPKSYAFWAIGNLQIGKMDSTENEINKFRSNNVTVGLDFLVAQKAIVGVSTSYAHDRTNLDGLGGKVVGSQFSVSTYGVFEPSAGWLVEGQIGIGRLDFDNRRYSAIEADTLSSSRSGNSYYASIGLRKQLTVQSIGIEPYARAQHVKSKLDSYNEGSSPSSLSFDSLTVTSNSFLAGVDGFYDIHLSNGATLTPNFKLELRHNNTGGFSQSISLAQTPGEVISVGIDAVPANMQVAGLGLRYGLKDKLAVNINWEVTNGSGSYRSNTLRAEMDIPF